ncbi:uncharacterized protein LOC143034405 isoform X2 [Oratosquilla oratoria]|uniref:uncharacterized protein LOC143034405 isoform X2 n=1 Tax=Oratosquilla oratoria TaxID=337810 RepID=UPI003F7713A8
MYTRYSVERARDVVVLQKKWKNIRDHYRKECARRKTEKSGSGASSAKKEYIYYSQLSFLSSTVETRPQKSSDKVEEDTDVQTARSECSQDLPKIQAKKKKVSHEDSLIGALSANIYKQIQEPKEDADKDFLMSLLPYVKSAPDSAKLECRCEIMQVLKKYNTPSINPMQYAPYPKRLTSDKLLSACLLGKTQNDSGIRCSKDEAGVSRAGADGVIGLGDCEPQVYVDVAEDSKDSIRGKHAMRDTEEHSASDRRKLTKIEDDTDVKIDISKERIYVETNEEFILPNRNEPMDTSFYIKQEPDDSGRVKQEPDDSGRVKQEPDDSGRLYIKQEPGDSGTV